MRAWIELAKPRIAVLSALTAGFGYLLSGGPGGSGLAWTLVGTGLAAASTGCLNQVLEREEDARMFRTRGRPLPSGRIRPAAALAYGLALAASGIGLLAWRVGPWPAFLAALTGALYLLGYTPLKKITPQSTWVGAAAGAMPPLVGWSAGAGRLEPDAWVLFAIQFIWQIPHFLALFWIHREDYARAGFRVTAVVDPRGGSTALQIAIHSFALLPATLLPALTGQAGLGYGFAALAAATAFLAVGMRASWTLALADTRRLFLASLAYLPFVFSILILGA